jgi:phosphoribosylaminoimidazole-succinocarboxamide synthase
MIHTKQTTAQGQGHLPAPDPLSSRSRGSRERLGKLTRVERISGGKVRDLYSIDGDVLLVASDRISVFDVVLPTPIPDKGALLTQLSVWWFHKLRNVTPNHLISATDVPPEFQNRAIRCTPLRMIPVECIARGYLAGLGLREYEKNGTVSGVSLPAGLVSGSRLPEPIFTPTTKFSETGHDEFITFDNVAREVGKDTAQRLRSLTLELYRAAAEHAQNNGVIVADTKFEFGWDAAGELTLGDEAVTSDSSRFWLAEKWRPGQEQYALDKQFVRDALGPGWNREPPGPSIPPPMVAETRRRYIEAYERITGSAWCHSAP